MIQNTSPSPPSGEAPAITLRTTLGRMPELGATVAFVIVFIVLAIMAPNFLTKANLTNIALQISIVAIVAIGQSFVMIMGGFDLSVGSLIGLSGIVAMKVMKAGSPPVLAVVASLAVGCLVGLVNGTIITRARINALITTLGMLTILRGTTFLITNGRSIGGTGEQFVKLGRGFFWEIPIPVCIMICLLILAFLALRSTKLGRIVYAVGGNEEATRLSGINVIRYKTIVYAICGMLAALGGVVLAARVNAGVPAAGTGVELETVAAVVLGGIALSGGEGSVIGTILGVLILGTLSNGLILMDVASYWQDVTRGAVLILAVLFDQMRRLLR